MPSQRAGDINYYEELGVETDASAEQIRDAFRALVRLLHPDHHIEDQLREIAEQQMRKLNRIYSVLSDPDRRRHYDELLRDGDRPRTIIIDRSTEVDPRRQMARFAWIGAAVVSLGFLVWLASDNSGGPQVQAFERNMATPASSARSAGAGSGDPTEDINQLRSELRAAREERDAVMRELTRLRSAAGDAQEQKQGQPEQQTPGPSPATAVAELPSPAPALSVAPGAAQAKQQPPAKPEAGAPRQFAGFWFYTRPSQGQHNNNRTLYPPEFIEATLIEQNGVIHGKYRSRYRIVDRAISPDVNFDFTGAPTGGIIACPWSGTDGSRGELTLRLTGDSTLRIDWTANELGNLQGLSSGTAILNRREE